MSQGEAPIETRTGRRPKRRQRLAVAACWLLAGTAIVMAVMAVIEFRSILFTGPALALSGVAAFFCLRRIGTWANIGYTLSAPAFTALIALLIAAFSWSPSRAHLPCGTLIVVYALAAAARAWRVRKASLAVPLDATTGQPVTLPRFSLKATMLWMSACCVVMAIVSSLAYTSFESAFATYALIVLSIVALLANFHWLQQRSLVSR